MNKRKVESVDLPGCTDIVTDEEIDNISWKSIHSITLYGKTKELKHSIDIPVHADDSVAMTAAIYYYILKIDDYKTLYDELKSIVDDKYI